MSNIQTKERIHYFDVAKGLLIVVLVLHHFPMAARDAGIINPFFGIMSSWTFVFYCFFMQCFLMISGYCSNFDAEPLDFLKKILRLLIVPWVVFELFEVFFRMVFYSDFSITRFRDFFFTEPNTTLWFLLALAFAKMSIYLLKKYLNIKLILLITFLLLLGAVASNQFKIGHNYFAIKDSIGACFFVAFGYYLKKNPEIYKILLRYCPYIFITLLVVLKLLKLGIPGYTAGPSIPLRVFPVSIVLGITGSISFILLCKVINKNQLLEYFGRNSLIVYGLHFCPLVAFVTIYNTILSPTSYFEMILYLLIVYASEFLICALFVQLMQLKYTKWIIGK